MKLLTYFATLILLIFISACSTSVESRLEGVWKAGEIKITASDPNFSKENEDALRRMEKSVSFVFNEDYTMKARTGSTTINGTWSYDENTEEVFVNFEGDADPEPKLFGVISGSKLISTRDSKELKIQTTYIKK